MEQLIFGTLPEWAKGSDYGFGYGYGYGYGDDEGSGHGYGDGGGGPGYGYGSGSGDGYGYSSGYGSGYSDGYGWGTGSGYGYGSGHGDGYGYGSGSGSGSQEYWLSTIKYFAAKWEPTQRARLLALFERKVTIAFWRSDKNGLPTNGGKNIEAAASGVVHKARGPLNLCAAGTLHATLLPPKWRGERMWIVALTGEVIGDEEKYGALSREVIGECL